MWTVTYFTENYKRANTVLIFIVLVIKEESILQKHKTIIFFSGGKIMLELKESNYVRKDVDGDIECVYTNPIYTLTLKKNEEGINASLDGNGNTHETIMYQLMVDIRHTTMKMEALMDAFNAWAEKGVIPKEYVDALSESIYSQPVE